MSARAQVEPQVYSVAEFRRIMCIGRNTAYEAIKTGKVKSVALGGRILIPRREVDRLLSGEAAA